MPATTDCLLRRTRRTPIEMPGNNGGANFGGAAVDPHNGNALRRLKGSARHAETAIEQQRLQLTASSSPEDKGHAVFVSNCQLCHGADRKGQPPAIPSLEAITKN